MPSQLQNMLNYLQVNNVKATQYKAPRSVITHRKSLTERSKKNFSIDFHKSWKVNDITDQNKNQLKIDTKGRNKQDQKQPRKKKSNQTDGQYKIIKYPKSVRIPSKSHIVQLQTRNMENREQTSKKLIVVLNRQTEKINQRNQEINERIIKTNQLQKYSQIMSTNKLFEISLLRQIKKKQTALEKKDNLRREERQRNRHNRTISLSDSRRLELELCLSWARKHKKYISSYDDILRKKDDRKKVGVDEAQVERMRDRRNLLSSILQKNKKDFTLKSEASVLI